MVRHGAKGLFVGAGIEGATALPNPLLLVFTAAPLECGPGAGQTSGRLSWIAQAVVFCTEDLQLIKDPLKASTFHGSLARSNQPTYLHSLQQYVRLLRSRNALLKQARVDAGSLEAFTSQLVLHGQSLIDARVRLIPRLAPLAQAAYRRIL